MKKLALILASAIAAPAFAGSMHGADWGNLIAAIAAPAPVVVVQPQPVYVQPQPIFLVGTDVALDGRTVRCRYSNGTYTIVYAGMACPQ